MLSSDDPILRRLHVGVEAGVPVVLHGEPGGGKTARIAAYVKARSGALERWLLSRCEPIDLKPRLYQDGVVVVGQPPELARLGVAASQRLLALLFLDELNRAARAVEGAALDIIDNPPEGVRVVAACNPPSRGQAARSLEAAAANRFCHLTVDPDPIAWAKARTAGWGVDAARFDSLDVTSDEFKAFDERARSLADAFIRSKPGHLSAPPDNPKQAGMAWASPRTWEYAHRLYAAGKYFGVDEDDLIALVGGCIGDGIGSEWLAFCANVDLVDPEILLKDPSSYQPPAGRIDIVTGVLSGVAAAIRRDPTPKRWEAGWALLKRLEDVGQADATIIGATYLQDVYSGLAGNAAQAALKPPSRLMTQRVATVLVSVGQKNRKAA